MAVVAIADSKNAWKNSTVGSEKLKCDFASASSFPMFRTSGSKGLFLEGCKILEILIGQSRIYYGYLV